MNMSKVLFTICHDPYANLLHSLPLLNLVKASGFEMVCHCTIETDATVTLKLNDLGVYCTFGPRMGLSHARYTALKEAAKSKHDQYLYFDIDRLLLLLKQHPVQFDNLTKRLETEPPEFMIIGRTLDAMLTHQSWQIRTEKAANDIFEIATDINADIMAGARTFNHTVACTLLNSGVSLEGATVDIGWPLTALKVVSEGIKYHELDLNYESGYFGIERRLGDETDLRFSNLLDIIKGGIDG
jgi:hypothetical protein